MPIIVAHILEGRTAKVRTQLIRSITETVAKTLEVPEETVRVIVSEMGKENYGIGGKTARELGR